MRNRTPKGLLLAIIIVVISGCNLPIPVSELGDQRSLQTVALGNPPQPLDPVLRLLVFEDLIPTEVINLFEKRYRVRIELTEIEQVGHTDFSEALISSADVILAPDWIINELSNNQLLKPINQEHIPNSSNLQNGWLAFGIPQIRENALPFLFETIGIAFDSRLVDGLPKGVDIIDDIDPSKYPFGYLAIVNDPVVFTLLSSPLNALTPSELMELGDTLIDAHHTYGVTFPSRTQAHQKLVDGEILVAAIWSRDAAVAMESNHSLRFVASGQKPLSHSYALAISASEDRRHNAAFFINYLLIPEVSAAISNSKNIGNFNQRSYSHIHPLVMNGPGFPRPPFTFLSAGTRSLVTQHDINLLSERLVQYAELDAQRPPVPEGLEHDRRQDVHPLRKPSS